jgi:uncharacterized protein YjiS (DUF1127 family)
MATMLVNQSQANRSLARTRQSTATSLGAQLLLALSVALHQWRSRSVQRRILAGMSDAHLKDIGLSRADVEGEVMKHFWQQ